MRRLGKLNAVLIGLYHHLELLVKSARRVRFPPGRALPCTPLVGPRSRLGALILCRHRAIGAPKPAPAAESELNPAAAAAAAPPAWRRVHVPHQPGLLSCCGLLLH